MRVRVRLLPAPLADRAPAAARSQAARRAPRRRMRWSASNTNPWFALPRGCWGVSSLQRAPTQPFCFLLQFCRIPIRRLFCSGSVARSLAQRLPRGTPRLPPASGERGAPAPPTPPAMSRPAAGAKVCVRARARVCCAAAVARAAGRSLQTCGARGEGGTRRAARLLAPSLERVARTPARTVPTRPAGVLPAARGAEAATPAVSCACVTCAPLARTTRARLPTTRPLPLTRSCAAQVCGGVWLGLGGRCGVG